MHSGHSLPFLLTLRVRFFLPIFSLTLLGCVEMPPSPAECASDGACDDGLFCNGAERCVDGMCVTGQEPCAGEPPCAGCDEDADACVVSECVESADCDDGVFCNGVEMCQNCVCIDGDSPCDAAELCDEQTDTCDVQPAALSCEIVNASRCIAVSPWSTSMLNSEVTNATGELSFMWTSDRGVVADPESPTCALELPRDAMGTVTVTLTVVDDLGGVGGDAQGENTGSRTTTCDATFPLGPQPCEDPPCPIVPDPPTHRILIPNSIDFGGVAPFSQGAALTSGRTGGAVPRIIAAVGRFCDEELDFQWEVVGAPALGRVDDVVLSTPDQLMLDYVIEPNADVQLPTITAAGQIVPISNVVVPGRYTFWVTVTDPEWGSEQMQEWSHTVLPAFEALGPTGE